MKKILAASAASAVLVAGAGTAAVLTAGPASADTERRGVCANGTYDFSVDREDGGYEVSVDLDNLTPGTRWVVALRHDGKVVSKRTIIADNEGDVELETFRPNTAGSDRFAFTAKRAGAKKAACSAVITKG